ncbi:DUF4082 domain-containing protein [Anaeromyxobacter sp. PSR-1]|uniref:DUF4082 domain-containing protein n=1 Tax=Anaeromyxobacter sp. PSR-1 TaxID=1300915 RepID=UPI0005DD6AB1|nr:DUF4082 domain-containing protein [Anaeromyxobacter sp. PSR-1]GAO01930.1 hypothetical protein PSR1_00793 [Anaeromyxobacter sp. PSR-1]
METLWSLDTTPAASDRLNDTYEASGRITLGVTFQANRDGNVTGVRHWKSTNSTSETTHLTLWSINGTKLAETVNPPNASGAWIGTDFSSPVHITSGTWYRASYTVKTGSGATGFDYSRTTGYFLTDPRITGSLAACVDGNPYPNGMYSYSGAGNTGSSFSNTSAAQANYWVTPVFVSDADASTNVSASLSPVSTSIELRSQNIVAGQDFTDTTVWTTSSTTITPGQLAPNGTNTATEFRGRGTIYGGIATTVATLVSPPSTEIRWTVYAKLVSTGSWNGRLIIGSTNAWARFDLVTGDWTYSGWNYSESPTMVAVGDGWYKLTLKTSAKISQPAFKIDPQAYSFDSGDAFLIWNPETTVVGAASTGEASTALLAAEGTTGLGVISATGVADAAVVLPAVTATILVTDISAGVNVAPEITPVEAVSAVTALSITTTVNLPLPSINLVSAVAPIRVVLQLPPASIRVAGAEFRGHFASAGGRITGQVAAAGAGLVGVDVTLRN